MSVVFVSCFGLAATAMAGPVVIQMEGEWLVQYDYTGSTPMLVPVAVPPKFTATITFDSSSTGTFFSDPPANYLTQYGTPTISSNILGYRLPNPFGYSSPSGHTALSRFNYSGPEENYQFSNGEYASVREDDITRYWNYGFAFHSPLRTIALEDIGPVSPDEFLEILKQSSEERQLFYVSFYSYLFETPDGSSVTYTGGIGLAGNAWITDILMVSVPAANAILVFAGGTAVLLGGRRRRGHRHRRL